MSDDEHAQFFAYHARGLAAQHLHTHRSLDMAEEELSGKGLARYRISARFQPLPIRTAREVFPQAAHPLSFIERVMGRIGHDGYFREYSSTPGKGVIFQSQYSPRTS